jgi:DNA ligase (NAD+)
MPESCPVCQGPVHRDKDEAVLRCNNSTCPAQVKARIRHFAAKGAFDIDGLGEKLTDQLVTKGMLTSYADIFYLDKASLQGLERMGPKSAQNLIHAIEKSKAVSFARFLYALGIRHVGENIADILATRFEHIDRLFSASLDELKAVEGIGPEIAESVRHFFEQDDNRKTVRQILDSGVQIISEAKPETRHLKGKSFVLTGTLEGMTRNEAKKRIEDAGGKVVGSVSRNTDYLVAGKSPGSKLDKAKELGIRVINEAEFLELI